MKTADLIKQWEEQKKEVVEQSEKGISLTAAVCVHLKHLLNENKDVVLENSIKIKWPLWVLLNDPKGDSAESAYCVVLHILMDIKNIEEGGENTDG